MNISAIVVTYFPTEILLSRLLLSIIHEVNKVYVIDNTPNESLEWLKPEWFAKSDFNVEYKSLGDNYGIATAQNAGIDLAVRDGCDHIIFFDQDSAPSTGMIENLARAEIKLIDSGVKVGSIGPLLFDEKYKKYVSGIRHWGMFVHKIKVSPNELLPVLVDYIIASGSLIRLSILHEVGVMRDELFIDWVDIEWGLRAENFGCSHFVIPDAIMFHSIGDEFLSIGDRNINLHSDIRNYYIIRNECHLLFNKSLNWRWRINILFKIPMHLIFYSFFTMSKNRLKTFVLLLRACSNGFAGRLGKAF